MRLISLVFVLLSSLNLFGFGNNPLFKNSNNYNEQLIWYDLNFGLGFDYIENSSSLLTGISSDFGYAKTGFGTYELKIGYHKEFKILESPVFHIFEIGLMTGYISYGSKSNSYLMIGLGFVNSPKYFNKQSTNSQNGEIITIKTLKYRNTVGIPFEIKTNYNMGDYFGLGIVFDGNINLDMPYIGLNLFFSLKY